LNNLPISFSSEQLVQTVSRWWSVKNSSKENNRIHSTLKHLLQAEDSRRAGRICGRLWS